MEEKIFGFLVLLLAICFGVLVYAKVQIHDECKKAGGVIAGYVCVDKSAVVKTGKA